MDVREQDGRIVVTVTNSVSAAARTAPTPGSGLGLVGMHERVESSNGRMSVTSDGNQFQIRAEFSPRGELVR